MNILIANYSLANVGGTEMFTLTIGEELIKQNFNVEYFTFKKGLISDRIEELGIQFMSKKKYDLILANHNTCVRRLKNKGFIIQTCHGIYPDLEQPSNDADAHVSISTEIQNHLANLGFFSKLILNPINIDKYKVTCEINDNLRNVLSLCHSEEAHALVEACCMKLKLNFSKIDKYTSPSLEIEKVINNNDIVIGVGRSLYDSMACGRPVISFDYRKQYMDSYGDGYIIPNFGLPLLNNCSGRYSKIKFDEDLLINELLKYNSKDGLIAREIIVKNFNAKEKIKEYLDYYHTSKNISYMVYFKKIFRKLFL